VASSFTARNRQGILAKVLVKLRFRLVIPLAIFLLSFSFSLAQSFEEAQLAYRESQTSRAYELLKELLEANPENRDAQLLLGYVYYRLEAYELAEEAFAALAEQPQSAANADVYYGLALAQRGLGKRSTALESAQRALSISPRREDIRALVEGLAASPGDLAPPYPRTLPFALPVSLVAVLVGSYALVSRFMPRPGHRLRDRMCAAALLSLAFPIGLIALLGQLGSLGHGPVLVATLLCAALAVFDAGREGRRLALSDFRAALTIMWRTVSAGAWAMAFAVGAIAVGLAGWAAYLLVPWAWDALGHHLPLVHDAIQTGELREVPSNNPYINTYPLAVNLYFVWWRLLLPDDTFIDLAQLPFGLAACLAVAALAVRGGVPAPRALALSFLFLAVPVTALQLASNYTDIGYAAFLLLGVYFVTGPLDRAGAAFGALVLGLLLATKPSAPVALALMLVVTLIRAYRLRRVHIALAIAVAALAIGSPRYIENYMAYGNPVWPVEVRLGPLELPGEVPLDVILDNQVPEPYLHYGWLGRTVGSWLAWPEHYGYSMRIGGFGPLFALALLPSVLVALRWRPPRAVILPVALIAAATLATQWAHMSRHTLALPAALLVLTACVSQPWRPRWRTAADLWLAALAAWGLYLAVPGFTLPSPLSLAELARLPPSERPAAFGGLDGHERLWGEARAFIRPGEAFGHDRSFGLAGLLWRPDGQGHVAYLPSTVRSPEAFSSWLRDERVRVVVLGDDEPHFGPWARAQPERFVKLFDCPVLAGAYWDCAVYLVMAERPLGDE
jgi:tetratricopeptide (TPR) repeat protein